MQKIIEKVCRKIRIIAWLLGIVFILHFTGCATGRSVIITTDESIRAGQISTATIEAINGEIGRVLSIYDSIIGGEIGRAIRGIDDALDALVRYDAFVRECIQSLRRIEYLLRAGEATDKDANEMVMEIRYIFDSYVGVENCENNPWLCMAAYQ